MSVKCCAAGCSSESEFNQEISFFQFPENKERCHDWLESIGREDLKDLSIEDVCSQYYVCSLHFDENFLQTIGEDGINNENESNEAVMQNEIENEEQSVDTQLGNGGGNFIQVNHMGDVVDEDGKTKLVYVEGIGHVRLKTEDPPVKPAKNLNNFSNKDAYIYHGSSRKFKNQSNQKIQKVVEQDGNYYLYVVDDNNKTSTNCATTGTAMEAQVNDNIIFVKDGEDILKALGTTINIEDLEKSSNQEHNLLRSELSSSNNDLSDHLKIEKPDELDDDGITNHDAIDDNLENDDINEIFKFSSPPKTFLCHTCGQDFKNLASLSNHMNRHHNVLGGEGAEEEEEEDEKDLMIFKCADCGQTFNMFDQLRTHVRTHVQSRSYSCDVCGAAFSHRSNLSRHKLQHCSAKKFQCDQCGKGFSQKSNLMSHQSTIHANDGPVFISSLNFNTRPGAERIHRKPKLHSCDICHKTFVSITGLKNHGALHTGVRPYKCAVCDKSFTLMSCLKTHMATIHTDKKHYCELCGKSYQSEHYLKIHLRIHTGTKDFECELCSKRFIDLPSLKLHTRTHTGEKPFICKMCSRSFTQQSHLKTHMRIHTGEKPYQCKDCGKFFRQLSNVLEHSRTHRKS